MSPGADAAPARQPVTERGPMSRTVPAQPRNSSKKMRKGIVAGIAGIALLAGGGASFATWSDTYSAQPQTPIQAGTLDLRPVANSAAWTGADGQPINPSSVRLIPGGPAVTYTEQIFLEAEGAG